MCRDVVEEARVCLAGEDADERRRAEAAERGTAERAVEGQGVEGFRSAPRIVTWAPGRRPRASR